MTENQINDIDQTWQQWFPNEDLPRIGVCKLWALSPQHPCYIAAFLHDVFYPDADGIVFHYLKKWEVDSLFRLWWSGCITWQTLRNKRLRLKLLLVEETLFYFIVRLFNREFVYNDPKTFNDFGLTDRLRERLKKSKE